MAIDKPYRRTVRPHSTRGYSSGGQAGYILHPQYADSGRNYIRAFLLIQKDLLEIFDYIEPSDVNIQSYSYRIHELLLRTCVEVEANFKAILRENGYQRSGDWNMSDYKKVNASHNLAAYKVMIHDWQGDNHKTRTPFSDWDTASLPWYRSYNSAKHDRHDQFQNANFYNLTEAVCGLSVLIASQFYTEDFSPSPDYLASGGAVDGYKTIAGDYFLVRFPGVNDWEPEKLYAFEWQELRDREDPFDQYPYV